MKHPEWYVCAKTNTAHAFSVETSFQKSACNQQLLGLQADWPPANQKNRKCANCVRATMVKKT